VPTQVRLMDQFFVKVGGSDLPTTVMDDLFEVAIDSSLYLPASTCPTHSPCTYTTTT